MMSKRASCKCDICGKVLSDASALRVHKIRHRPKEELPFKCSKCDHKAAAKREILRHEEIHLPPEALFKCSFCPKMFKRKLYLHYHVEAVHLKNTLYKCNLCDYQTFRKVSLRVHMNSHSEEKKIKCVCPVCKSSFQTKLNLKNHLLAHTGLKTFCCSECDKTFTMLNRLLAHIKFVHGPKTKKCNHCHKTFANIHRLNRHLLTHSGIKPFSCCYCKHSSNTQGNLMKHIRNIHGKINDTYKDVLIKSGKLVATKDPSEISPTFVNEGKKIATALLQSLKEQKLCDLTLDQINCRSKQKNTTPTSCSQNHRTRLKQNKTSSQFLKTETVKEELSLDVNIEDDDKLMIPKMNENVSNESNCIVLLPSNALQVEWTDLQSSNISQDKIKKQKTTGLSNQNGDQEMNSSVTALTNTIMHDNESVKSFSPSQNDLHVRSDNLNDTNPGVHCLREPKFNPKLSSILIDQEKPTSKDDECVENKEISSPKFSSLSSSFGHSDFYKEMSPPSSGEAQFSYDLSFPGVELLPPKMEINLPTEELYPTDSCFVVLSEDTSEALSNITIKESSQDSAINEELNIVSIAEFDDKFSQEMTIHIQ